MTIAAYFDPLGAQIERAFRAVDYDELRFPDIAGDALSRAPAHRAVSAVEILSEVAIGAALPPQLVESSAFGQPPVTVFEAERFVIDVYFWFDGTTSTHEHGFCGAFQVLGGSSLHAVRRFECRRRVNTHFLMGDVQTQRCEVLTAGDTRPILPGRAFGHALFHLDSPSTTIVVRTKKNADAQPQYAYAPPYIAYDSLYKPRVRELQHEALRALARVDTEAYIRALDAALADATIESAYFLLEQHGLRCIDDTGLLDDAMFTQRSAVCAAKHGREATEQLVECVRHACRVRDLVASRRRTRDPAERFLLAVLLNAYDRAQVLEFMRQRYPADRPVESFMTTFTRICAPSGDGENVLGVELGEDAMICIRLLLEGAAPAELPGLVFEKYGRSASAEDREALARFWRDLLQVPALSVLGR